MKRRILITLAATAIAVPALASTASAAERDTSTSQHIAPVFDGVHHVTAGALHSWIRGLIVVAMTDQPIACRWFDGLDRSGDLYRCYGPR